MKILSYIPIFFISLGMGMHAHGQNAIFLSQGRIEYERKINLYAQIDDDEDESWKELEKKSRPQFKTSYFDLLFRNGKTMYKPGRENTDNNRLWQEPAEDNTVYTNLETQQSIAQKNVFEQKFLVQDSTRPIKWKITDEKRNIAGFECRRANGLIMDSIYLVAFYTDVISSVGGPECFSGLPGMILGVAIPHEHVTWFATKVFTETISDADLVPPAKGKKVTNLLLLTTLQDRLKDWGKWGRRFIQAIML